MNRRILALALLTLLVSPVSAESTGFNVTVVNATAPTSIIKYINVAEGLGITGFIIFKGMSQLIAQTVDGLLGLEASELIVGLLSLIMVVWVAYGFVESGKALFSKDSGKKEKGWN